MSLPFRLSEAGEPVVTVRWVEYQLEAIPGMLVSGRVDLADMQIKSVLRTLSAIIEALRVPVEPSGDV